nr:putative ribonuclease H-like domain-containing protein [Tanacetum cinerariifolium]
EASEYDDGVLDKPSLELRFRMDMMYPFHGYGVSMSQCSQFLVNLVSVVRTKPQRVKSRTLYRWKGSRSNFSGTTSGIRACREALIRRRFTPKNHPFSSQIHSEIEHSNPTLAKIPILDIGKFEQWKFRIQQYLQNEHYALWEVIEFDDSYEAPKDVVDTDSASEGSAKKKGRTVAGTTEDMQKRRNDVKARTTLLLALSDEHQLRFTKNSSGNGEVNTASIPTASTQVSSASANIKYEDINQIDEDDIEEMDIKWNMALLSMRADRYWKKTGKKISIQGTDVAGFDKSKVECFNCHKMGHFARECRAPRSQDKGRRENFKQGSKVEESAPKALMAIDGVFDNSLCSKACKKNADSLNTKITNLSEKLSDSKTMLYHYKLGSQRSDKNKEGLGYNVVPPPAQVYSPLKKDMSWTGIPEFADDIITDYSRPSRSIESNSSDFQNSDSSVSENGESSESIMSKPMIKFVKAADSPTIIKTNKDETGRNPSVKYAEMYRKTSKSSNGKSRPKNNTHKSIPPRTVFHKSDRSPTRTTRPNMNAAQPKRTSFYKPTHSYVSRRFQRKSTVRNQFRVPRFPTVNRKFPTVNRKFPTGNSKVSTADLGNKRKAVKASACWIWKPKQNSTNKSPNSNSVSVMFKKFTYIDTQGRLKSDSGCFWHMTGNISYLSDYEPYDGGYVSFGQGGCKITGKGTIKTGKLEFENVYFVKDLKYNLFSVSQICDNKNSVLFINSECIVLGRDFKLRDDTNVLLRTPRQHNMYSIDLNNIVSHKDLTCLVAKASTDESMIWKRRLGHLNFKTMNRLVKHNLVRGLPSKCFDNDHTCVACLKGKQHKASCKTKVVNSVTKPRHTLHMDLFWPTSVSSLNHKWYCLVVTGDFSRFTWTFFLKTKDESSGILRNFITEIENLKYLKVKIIRCDNGGEFRNKEMNDFCSRKGIKREFSNARTPQQNGVAERRNRTLIEAARTMVLVNKSQNKTPYELFNGRTPVIGFLKPFGCHVMILNTLDHLGKFEAKKDEVVSAGTTSTNFSGTKEAASQDVKKDVSSLRYIALSNCGNFNPTATSTNPPADQMETLTVETLIPTVSSPVPTACLDDSPQLSSDTRLVSKRVTSQDDSPSLDNILTLSNRFEDILGVSTNSGDTNRMEADLSNMENNISASPTPTLRIHKDHPTSQIIGHVDTPVQTRTKSKEMEEQSFIASIHHMTNLDLLQFCLFSCFLSLEEPKKISDALKDPSW